MIAEPGRVSSLLHGLAMTAALLGYCEGPVLACDLTCGFPGCPQLGVGPEMETYISEDLEWDEQCGNPPGSEEWTPEEWANYFGLWASGLDEDEQLKRVWITGDPCYDIPCVPGWAEEWELTFGGPVDITWSMPGGPPDVSGPGTYTFRATYTNLADTDTDPPCHPDWLVDDPPVTRDCHVTVRGRGKCCEEVCGMLQAGCDIRTADACNESETLCSDQTPNRRWFGDDGACCDWGACWKNPPGNYPSPCVNGANCTCCTQWPGNDFLEGKTCCGVTEPAGYWRAWLWEGGCNSCSGDTTKPIDVVKDDCGNRLEIWCQGWGWPICNKRYKFYYSSGGSGGYQISECVFPGNRSRFLLRRLNPIFPPFPLVMITILVR